MVKLHCRVIEKHGVNKNSQQEPREYCGFPVLIVKCLKETPRTHKEHNPVKDI